MFGPRIFCRVPCLLGSHSAQGRWVSSTPTSGTNRVNAAEDVRELNNFFPAIVDAAKNAVQVFHVPPSETKWLERMLEYNVDRVRWLGAIITLNAMRELSGQPRDAIPPEVIHKAKYLAWCSELMTASFNMVDDILDGGEVRWDKPSWHMLPDVRFSAICDAFLLENMVFQLLRQQFKGSQCYDNLVDLYMDSSLGTYLGQNDDTHIARPGRAMEDDFTPARYEMAARLKTSGTLFYAPVVSALIASGVQSSRAYAAARDISVDLSVIIQIQDDFSDCFGEDKMDRSMDIRNGSCTWMILEAKRIADANQLQILKENYGYADDSKVDAVKGVFDELGLKERLIDYRRKKYELVRAKIEENGHTIPPNIFKYALDAMEDKSVEYLKRNPVE